MRSRLILVPVAAVAMMAAAAPAQAETYLTIPQAQQLLFPNASFTRDFIWLWEAQRTAVQTTAKAPQWSNEVKLWRVSTGGWFIIDQAQGRDDMVTYAIGIDAAGAVTGIEILECLDKYDGIRNPAWRRQFVGLRQPAQVDEDRFQLISGTSLSSIHIVGAVRRDLIIFDLVLRQRR